MKKLSNKVIYFLVLLLIMSTACTNDEDLIPGVIPTIESATINKSLTALGELQGITFNDQSDVDAASAMILDFGFNFVYPIQLSYNNGSTVTIQNFDELDVIVNALNPNLFIDEISFPFGVEVLNQENNSIELQTIVNEDTFKNLISDLNIGVDEDCVCTLEYNPVYVEIIKSNNDKIIVSYPNACAAMCDGFSPEDFVNNPDDCICTEEYDPVYIEKYNPNGVKTIEKYSNACQAICKGYTEFDFVDEFLVELYPESVDCFSFIYPITLLPVPSLTTPNYEFQYPFSIFSQGDEVVINSAVEFDQVSEDCRIENDRVITESDLQTNPIISDRMDPTCMFSKYTKHIYNITDKKAVAVVMANSIDMEDSISMKFYVFSQYESDARISRFVNNLHSDAIYIDSAKPIATYDIPKQYIVLTRKTDLGEIPNCETIGNVDRTMFNFRVSEFLSSDNQFSFEGFSSEITVYDMI